MRLIRHILDKLWIGSWEWLARHGIGDPLNQLIYVAPFRAVAKSYHYRPRKIHAYRRHYKTEAKIANDLATLNNTQSEKGEKVKIVETLVNPPPKNIKPLNIEKGIEK